MKKIRNFFKLPAFILSCVLVAGCLTWLIVACVRDVSMGTYYYKHIENNIVSETTLTFDKNEVVMESVSKENGVINASKIVYDYKIIDGKLFIKPSADIIYDEMGEINSTKIIIKEAGMSAIFTNNGAIASIVLSSIFLALTIVVSVGFGLYTFKDINLIKSLKPKSKKEAIQNESQDNE